MSWTCLALIAGLALISAASACATGDNPSHGQEPSLGSGFREKGQRAPPSSEGHHLEPVAMSLLGDDGHQHASGGQHHHDRHRHTHDSHGHPAAFQADGETSVTQLWAMALASTFLVSSVSLICLAMLPLCYGVTGASGKLPDWVMEGMTAFSGGAMLTDAFLHQIPHAFNSHSPHSHDSSHSSHLDPGLVVIAGIMLFFMVEKIMSASPGGHSHRAGHSHGAGPGRAISPPPASHQQAEGFTTDAAVPSSTSNLSSDGLKRRQRQLATVTPSGETSSAQGGGNARPDGSQDRVRKLSVAYLNLVADGVHNFTDGMAIGAAFLRGGAPLGWARTIAIIAHELPQEIGDYGILIGAGFTPGRALAWNLLSAMTAMVGTAVVLLAGSEAYALAEGATGSVEAFTAGGFIYIAVAGIMAELALHVSLGRTTLQLASMGLGVALCASIHANGSH